MADKDGISALLKVAELAALLKSEGRVLTDRLDDIAREHGLYATDQLSVRVADPQQTAATMARLRDDPPGRLGDLAVESVEDLSQGSDGLPPTEGIRYLLAERARVIGRPSGTEPKVKCYLQVVVPVDADEEDGVDAARIVAVQRLDAIRKDLDGALSS